MHEIYVSVLLITILEAFLRFLFLVDWDLEQSEDEDISAAPNAWGSQSQPKSKTKTRIPGQVYASKKARGDMRRPGQPDPYAYISLGSGLGGLGKTASKLERHRLLRAIGVGKQKRSKRVGGTTIRTDMSRGKKRLKSGRKR